MIEQIIREALNQPNICRLNINNALPGVDKCYNLDILRKVQHPTKDYNCHSVLHCIIYPNGECKVNTTSVGVLDEDFIKLIKDHSLNYSLQAVIKGVFI